jgi:hypothetical protein
VLDRPSHPSEEIESCRDNVDALLAAWAANDVEDTTLESLVFVQALVALDAWFGRRPAGATGGSDPVHEVRVIADSVIRNGGTLRVDDGVTWDPAQTVLGLEVGDEVELTADGFERLAAAYLTAVEASWREGTA